MKLKYYNYSLELKHTFRLANYSRNSTPVVLIEIEQDGITGYGEASMPQYLGEDYNSANSFLEKLNLSQFSNTDALEEIFNYINGAAEGNNAVKAGLDIALHDLYAKRKNKPLREIWNIDSAKKLETSYTIGISNRDELKLKIDEAGEFKFLKIKLGSPDDKNLIRSIRELTDKPLFVDVNQGWTDRHFALEMISWLAGENVILVEQPLAADKIEDLFWLKEKSPLPIVADEGIKRLDDLIKFKNIYSAVNIKLMKSAGLNEARKMIEFASGAGLKIMLGCMTETSCGIAAAAQLAPLCDWLDLDGNLLIANDPFIGHEVLNGEIFLNNLPGIGITKRK